MKRQKIIIICIVCVLLAGAAAGIVFVRRGDSGPEQKLIYENHFTEGYGGFSQDAYAAGRSVFSHLADQGMDGSGCLYIESTSANDARFLLTVDDVRKETYYRISAWVKTEGVGAEGAAVGANLSVLNTFSHSKDLTGDNDWTYLELYGKTGSKQTSFSVCLRLGFYSGDNQGKVWFDDVEIQQLSALPQNTSYVSFDNEMGDTVRDAAYTDIMLGGFFLFCAAAMFFIFAYRFSVKRDQERLAAAPSEAADTEPGAAAFGYQGLPLFRAVILMILLGFAVRLALSVTAPQCDIDVNLFKYWANQAAEHGISQAYEKAGNIDYPPLYMYFLYFNGLLAKWFGFADTLLYTMLMKLPAILCDCVIAYFIYLLCSKRISKNWVMLLVALWLFNPIVMLDSACWGQVDSMLTLALIGAMYFTSKDRFIPAAALLGAAVMVKPQGFMLVPILGYALFKMLIKGYGRYAGQSRTARLKHWIPLCLLCILVFAGTMILITLPFSGLRPISWLYELLTGTTGHYDYTTVNSLNFYFLLGQNWVKDSTEVLGLTYFTLGMLLIVAFSVLTWVLYQKGEKKSYLPYLLSAMLLYAVVTFGPRMHERYFFPVVALLLIAVIKSNNKLLLSVFGLMSISNFFSVLEIMTDLLVGGKLQAAGQSAAVYGYYYWPALNFTRGLMAAGNVISCAALVVLTCLFVFRVIRIDDKRFRIWSVEDENA